jgi:hypothetical protein
MSFLIGLLITLLITYPSFVFIHIYIDPAEEGLTVKGFFQGLFSGSASDLLDVCHTAINEPINIFFVKFDIVRILLALLPWIVAAFVINFFFRRRVRARGGISTAGGIYLALDLINMFVIEDETISVEILTQSNVFYGLLVINVLTLLIGLIASIISPYRGEKEKRRPPARAESPVYFMPEESPSRDNHVSSYDTFRDQSPNDTAHSRTCPYCGSYIEPASQYCNVCGKRFTDDDIVDESFSDF